MQDWMKGFGSGLILGVVLVVVTALTFTFAPTWGWVQRLASGDGALAQWIIAILSVAAFFTALYTIGEGRKNTHLAHPPRFKITRLMVAKLGPSGNEPPDFRPAEEIFIVGYGMNYGRCSAEIKESDFDIYWSPTGRVPMRHAYLRGGQHKNFNKILGYDPLEKDFLAPASKLEAGEFGRWTLTGKVPDDFVVRNSGWSHDLFVLGRIRYYGQAGEQRGYYFCKRYDPEAMLFHDVAEHENED